MADWKRLRLDLIVKERCIQKATWTSMEEREKTWKMRMWMDPAMVMEPSLIQEMGMKKESPGEWSRIVHKLPGKPGYWILSHWKCTLL